MSKKFEDPFDGWGKLAERFCITFFMFLPSLLFMRVVLEWFSPRTATVWINRICVGRTNTTILTQGLEHDLMMSAAVS